MKLRELLEKTNPNTECKVWFDDYISMYYGAFATGTADALLKRQDMPGMAYPVFTATMEDGRLNIQLAEEDYNGNDEEDEEE